MTRAAFATWDITNRAIKGGMVGNTSSPRNAVARAASPRPGTMSVLQQFDLLCHQSEKSVAGLVIAAMTMTVAVNIIPTSLGHSFAGFCSRR